MPKKVAPRRVVKAALDLAAKQGWRDTTLADIACEAKVSLAELLGTFRSKAAILNAFVDQIDKAMLEKGRRPRRHKAAARPKSRKRTERTSRR